MNPTPRLTLDANGYYAQEGQCLTPVGVNYIYKS